MQLRIKRRFFSLKMRGDMHMRYEMSCGAVVYTREHGVIQFLLVQQQEGFYAFPKGHMETNETERETVLREIYEEVGIRPTIIDGFRTVEEHAIPDKPHVIKLIVYFLAEYKEQRITVQEEELLSAVLASFEEAMELLEYESKRDVLKEAAAFLRR